ncbi:MAG: deoxyribonuclease V [Dehalococcoidales bacterium]|nr:deoxyribonuclease V [Dehalococcoidales bacterium]
MKVISRHDWHLSPRQAVEVQRQLASEVRRNGDVGPVRLIGGVDVSVDRFTGEGTAAVVVLSYPALEPVEMKITRGRVGFPYVPGLLSFRESPLVLGACEKIENAPDLILVDGQGIAHPRRMGIASHLGLLLDIPTIGCAKSRLCGECRVPADGAGSFSEITDGGEVIGAALRTREGVAPVYVSVGHRISLDAAIRWVMSCVRGYRIPEPLRLAHQAAGGNLSLKTSTIRTGADEGYQRSLF